jgi:hypothetical protein
MELGSYFLFLQEQIKDIIIFSNLEPATLGISTEYNLYHKALSCPLIKREPRYRLFSIKLAPFSEADEISHILLQPLALWRLLPRACAPFYTK